MSLENCKNGYHSLKIILKYGNDLYDRVVRWCPDCGGVRVDTDFDGRINYGKMMFPKIAYEEENYK